MKKQYLLTLLLLLVMSSISFAQETLSPVTKTFAIKDAHIIQKPGQIIEHGTIIIQNGLIHSVGKNIPIPANAKVLAADSMFVYAGFIDGISHTGIPQPEAKKGESGRSRRQKGDANPSYEKAGIQPQLQVRDLLNPKDKSIDAMRQLGYTAAHVVPRGKMLPGGGSLLLLNGQEADNFIYSDNVSLFSQLEGTGSAYPATLIAVMSKFRELYQQAKQTKTNERNYKSNPTGKARPSQDRVLQAFYPVIDKTQPIYFEAANVKDIHRVFTLQKELGFPLVLADVKQGWHLADKIKASRTPVFLSLSLPKDKAKKGKTDKDKGDKKGSEKKEVEKKEVEKKIEKKEKKEKELTPFQKKQQAAFKQYNAQAATFQNKGISFGFTSINTKATDIRSNLRTMIKHGLEEATAIAALTTYPAQQLGVSKSMGTLEKGKLANLVISDKSYFEEKSNVRFVIVEGKVYTYEVKKKKKSAGGAAVKVAGTWNYSISIPGTAANGVLVLKNEGGNISGTINNDLAEGDEAIQDAVVDGNELTFTVPVDESTGAKAEMTITIDGDTMEGSVSIPEMGTFDVEGQRVPK